MRTDTCVLISWHNLFHPLLQSHSTSSFFFFCCRLSLWNFEVALMTWGGAHFAHRLLAVCIDESFMCEVHRALTDDDWRGHCSSTTTRCFSFFAHYNLNATAVRLAYQVSRAWETRWRHKRDTVFTQVNVGATHVDVCGCHFKAAVRRQSHKRVIMRFSFLLSIQSTFVLSVASFATPPTVQDCHVRLF